MPANHYPPVSQGEPIERRSPGRMAGRVPHGQSGPPRSGCVAQTWRTAQVWLLSQLLLSLLLLSLLLISQVLLNSPAQAEDLTCLGSEVNGSGQPITWAQRLGDEARVALQRRGERLEQLKTAADIEQYQTAMREFFTRQLGGFPERVPLNAQVTGVLQGDGFRVEKVIFESQPNHRVTGNLYIPDGQGPFPGVLVSSGHSRTGKTADYNQRFGIVLAQHGIVTLCYDPIGQGERSQLVDDHGHPQFEATTHEHFLIGTGSILVGRNTATYRVWDAMRAADYLQSRPEVDPQRLGMTGCSGGGTLTSYTMALDPRIACAAPACYLTTFGRLIDTIGPQDSEQNIFGQLSYGMDHPDYVIMRAPRPTLISSTTADFFDISGSWENLRQAKRVYTRLGVPERVDLVEAEGVHGVQPENLSAIVGWMQRWLVGADRPVPVKPFSDIRLFPEAELNCTPRGQVLLLDGERSVFDLNREVAERLAAARATPDLLAAVRKAAAIRPADQQPQPTSNKAGKVQRDGYHIDKLVIHTDSGVPLPALTFHPADPDEAAYIYLHDGGKTADSQAGGAIEQRVRDGYVVVSVDLRGQGETSRGAADPKLGDWYTFYLAYLLGQSVVGAHAEDILATVRWTANYQSEKPREVHVIASGRTAIAALHAAALEPQWFTSLTLRGAPHTWHEVAGSEDQARWLTATVHGALADYDLPDLVRLLPEGSVRWED
jgi:cephalosporin-C deacetylase-like acetyl esterase